MKRPSKKQLASCITSLYTLSWPKWKQAAHLVACKISYKREEEEEKRITLAHIHTCVCICSRVFFLFVLNVKHIFARFYHKMHQKMRNTTPTARALVRISGHASKLLCSDWKWAWSCVCASSVHFIRIFFFCWGWGSFFCYFLNSLLCKLWIRYHSFAQHAFCCCFDHFEKLPKWWIGFFLVPFLSLSLYFYQIEHINVWYYAHRLRW